MTAAAPLARIRGITKRFGDGPAALAGVDLEIQGGQVLGLIGPNGSGKTTLLRILAGLAEPSAGRLELLGRPPATPRSPDLRRNIGLVSQDQALDPEMTGGETLRLFAGLYALPAAERRARVDEISRALDLSEILARPVARLSGGQRQRIHLAVALLQRPALLLLDEPTGALDPAVRAAFWDALQSYLAPERAVVVATHDLSDAEQRLDRVAIMSYGRVLAADSPSRLRERYARPRVEILFAAGTEPPSTLPDRLQSHAAVDTADLDGRSLSIRLNSTAISGSSIVEELRQAGLAIEEVREHAVSLEEAYFGLTGEALPAPDHADRGRSGRAQQLRTRRRVENERGQHAR